MNLPQEVRYRRYEDWSEEEITKIKNNVAASPWRATYHIEPQTGLLNDPNGFSYFNGKFHLFYQNWPFGAAHGLKSWVHTESTDLVHFTETGTVLYPDTDLDSHGAYSGSAFEINERLFLFYTGNVRDENWIRTPLQIGAWMDEKGVIEKIPNVLIPQPSDVTEHFRDPQIFLHNEQFYAIVGGQNLQKQGCIKLYKAVDQDVLNWQEIGNLDFGGTGSEYMIECPNLVFIDQQPVLLYSPQGLSKSELNYDNIYPNTYRVCQSFDTTLPALTNPSPVQQLDYGFECYATQAFNAPDGRVLAVSWIGLPDIDYPTDRFDYQGAMSLVKELTLKNNQLYQYPVKELIQLRQEPKKLSAEMQTDNIYELELTIKQGDIAKIYLFADAQGNGLKLNIDTVQEILVIDRSHFTEQYAVDFGTSRNCPLSSGDVQLNIFVDRSIVEIFVNKGEKVLTSRVFPNLDQTGIIFEQGNVTGTYFPLKAHNHDGC